MARLNVRNTPSDAESDQDSSQAPTPQRVTSATSASPALSFSSDKENHGQSEGIVPRGAKRKSASSRMPDSSSAASSSLNKRRKLGDRSQALPSQAVHRRELEERVNKQFYDPDQNQEERRATRKAIRDLAKELNGLTFSVRCLWKVDANFRVDSRTEYLQPNSNGLQQTLERADEYFKNVKQTSDATIDSRLLVAVGDLSYKKTNEIALGDSSTGVDVDEFVSKCISFMKRDVHAVKDATTANGRDSSSSTAPSGTQLQRRRRRPGFEEGEEEEEGGDEDDQLNWAHLGRNACFLYNSRPCLSGFLLGPLSVQKRMRQQTQRRAREARADPANAVRPQELRDEDLEKQETANLTVVCSEIRRLLGRIQVQGEKAVEATYTINQDITDEEAQDLMREHGLADNGHVPLFDFCVNPKSFGQTVENMFYVSFLIKEGSVGLGFDSRGMPTLGLVGDKTLEERQEAPKNQAVFTLDFEMWEEIIESHGIQKSLIPHRREEEYDDGTNRNEGGGGWYG
jgi:hypothetical protein